MKLNIDTRDRENIKISIIDKDTEVYSKEYRESDITPEKALQLIERAINKSNINKDDVTEVNVEKEAGSYTGVRVGVAIANAISFALKIPVNNKKVSNIEVPIY